MDTTDFKKLDSEEEHQVFLEEQEQESISMMIEETEMINEVLNLTIPKNIFNISE